MRRLLIAVVLLGSISSIGSAQDFDWSGPYMGAQFGYAFGHTESVTTNLVQTYPVPFSYSSSGPLGGLHAGYNFQSGRFVVGIEGEVEAAALAGHQAVDAYDVTYGSKTTSGFEASFRARAGIAFGQFLLYGTGGLAIGQVKIAYSCSACVSEAGATSTLDDDRTGWTAGAGVAYSLTRSVSLALEYRYTDLGLRHLIDVGQVADYHRNHFSFSAVRFGLSYHFSP